MYNRTNVIGYHNNQQLFSDHYLDVTLRDSPGWGALVADAGRLMPQIKAIFDAFVPSPQSPRWTSASPSPTA